MIHNVTLAAGTPQYLPGGNMVSIIDCEYDVRVTVRRKQRAIDGPSLVPVGWSYRAAVIVPDVNAFDEVMIESDTAQVVSVDVSAGISGAQSISGSVSVRESLRALAENEYTLNEFLAAGANRAHVQLWNPAGSNERLVVDGLHGFSSVAGTLVVTAHNAALATAGNNGVNKFLGGSDRAGDGRNGYSGGAATVIGTTLSEVAVDVAARSRSLLEDREAQYIIPPGWGLCVAGANGGSVHGSFRYRVVAES